MVENKGNLPNWIRNALTEDQVKHLSKMVAHAESQTSGEIVTVLVHSSTAVGHVKWILTGFFTALFFVFEAWYTKLTWGWHWTWLPLVAFAVILYVSHVLAKIDWVQRILTPQADEDSQVAQRAELEFYRSHIKKTVNGTGILIFVSWMEKRAVILADEGVAAHYPEETWDKVIQAMVTEFKKGHTFEAFEVAIRLSGEILKEKLPASAQNTNELKNSLIIKE